MKIIIDDEVDNVVKIGYYEENNHFTYHNINNLPALIADKSYVFFLKEGRFHRTNGPARIYLNPNQTLSNNKVFFLDGIGYTEEEYHKIINETNNK